VNVPPVETEKGNAPMTSMRADGEVCAGAANERGSAASFCISCGTLLARDLLYPPMDLSHFDTPITPAPSEIHFGYASMHLGRQ